MSRVILVGGGTAGHVEPALAVGRWLRDSGNSIECEFLGSASGIENRLVPEAGFPLHRITKAALPRSLNLSALFWPLRFASSLLGAARAIWGSSLVIGFGGYVSAPAYLVAKLLRIPIIIHEANVIPGFANRLGAPLATELLIAYPGTRSAGGAWLEADLVGMPIRNSIAEVAPLSPESRLAVRRKIGELWGIDTSCPIIFVFGGSLGARSLNRAIADFRSMAAKQAVTIIHSIGGNDPLPPSDQHYKAVAYVANMAEIYAIADLVISRSGAVTCAELASVNRFALLVPLPIGNGEQEANAQELVARGDAEVIGNADFTGEWLDSNIVHLLQRAKSYSPETSEKVHLGASKNIGERAISIVRGRI